MLGVLVVVGALDGILLADPDSLGGPETDGSELGCVDGFFDTEGTTEGWTEGTLDKEGTDDGDVLGPFDVVGMVDG